LGRGVRWHGGTEADCLNIVPGITIGTGNAACDFESAASPPTSSAFPGLTISCGEIIDATPTIGAKTFLVTHFGKPYTAPGFGNWFRELCDAAGCQEVSAHGLRKATARRLAEIGCTAHQIAAITGHASLSEVQRYTKAADRKRMAREAMAKLIEGGW
jgi:Phage integrase family